MNEHIGKFYEVLCAVRHLRVHKRLKYKNNYDVISQCDAKICFNVAVDIFPPQMTMTTVLFSNFDVLLR